MIQKTTNFTINGKHSKPILTDYFYKKNGKPKPIVIFSHGYKGYKDWGAWNLVAKTFAENDLFFVKFNFSHNGGTVDQPIDFPDLEAFGNNNFCIELDDLDAVISYIINDKTIENEINTKNISLIGHSRGGGIALLKAAEDKRITKVISWAGISDIESRFPKGEELAYWKKNKIAYITNARTKQQMPHKYSFYENFMANKKRLHIKSAVEKLTIPQLIVHGTADTVVLPKEAKNMHQWHPKNILFMVKNMNHALGSSQPYTKTEMPLHLQKVVSKTMKFIIL